MKISSQIPYSKKYFTKNTAQAKYERSFDMAFISGVGLTAQLSRFKNWEPEDIAITTFIGTIFLKSVQEAIKNKINLNSIKKRAKSILKK